MSAGKGDCQTEGEDSDNERHRDHDVADEIHQTKHPCLAVEEESKLTDVEDKECTDEEEAIDVYPRHGSCRSGQVTYELLHSDDVGSDLDDENQEVRDNDTGSTDDDDDDDEEIIDRSHGQRETVLREDENLAVDDDGDEDGENHLSAAGGYAEPTYIFSVRDKSANDESTRFETANHSQSLASAYGTPPSGTSYIHYELSSMSEIQELTQELKKFNRRGCCSFTGCISSLALIALVLVFLQNFARPLSHEVYDGKLAYLRKEHAAQKLQQELEEKKTDETISNLKARIEEEKAANEHLKATMRELHEKIMEEEQNFKPDPKGLEGQLKAQEETLLAEVVKLREKLKHLEVDSEKANKAWHELISIKKSILHRETDLHQAVLRTEGNIEKKCKRVRAEMESQMAKILTDLKELTKQEIPLIIKDKYEKGLIKKLLLDKASKAAVELLDETLKLKGKEKEAKVELEALQELEAMLMAQVEKKKQELKIKLDEKLKRKEDNLRELEKLEKLSMDKISPSQEQATQTTSEQFSSPENQPSVSSSKVAEANISHSSEEQSEEIGIKGFMQMYKLGSLGLVHSVPKRRKKMACSKNESHCINHLKTEKNDEKRDKVAKDVLSRKILFELGLSKKFE